MRFTHGASAGNGIKRALDTVSKTSYVSKYIKAEQLTNLAVAVFIRLSNQLIDLCIYQGGVEGLSLIVNFDYSRQIAPRRRCPSSWGDQRPVDRKQGRAGNQGIEREREEERKCNDQAETRDAK